jgi:mitochondrial enoyl-[acyl-carrier protein] reductase / trans-2-enoyl-CoA reductase
MNTLLGTPQPAAVGGNECCAEVIATGSSVNEVKKGDWVVMKRAAMGTWRTHAQVDEDDVIRIDEKEGLSALQVGTVSINPVTAYRMLKDFVSWDWGRKEEWFIQNGANSGVGRAAVQLGREWGMKSINVIRERPGWEELREELLGMGADVVITEAELLKRDFPDKVKEWTKGGREPVKLGLNCVGGKSATSIAKVLSPKAHMVTYGGMSKQPVMLPTGLLIFKEIVFDGFWVSQWGDKNPRERKNTIEDLLRMMRDGRFKDVPVEEVRWDWDTKEEVLKEAVQATLGGYRKGKGVFVFGET